jgi:FtsP/CotA-like multicopper oxidase with cupredoxin domain
VTSGRRQRWRVLNAARSRYFRLGLAGHRFSQIGGDGGRNEYPVEVEEPVITPGERLDLLLEPDGAPGTTLELMARPISRGLPLAESEAQSLLAVEFVDSALPPSAPLPELRRSIEPIDVTGAEQIRIALTIDASTERVVMGINDVPFSASEPLHAQVGTTQILMVENKSPYNHPFHLHGFYFQRLGSDLLPVHPLANKDTIDIPPLSLVPLAVAYDDRPGMWMFHCHILDHAEAGMMGMIHVMP